MTRRTPRSTRKDTLLPSTTVFRSKPVPRLVLLSHDLEEQALIAEALSLKAEHRVELNRPQRGAKRKLIDNALHNAREALARRLAESSSQRKLLEQLEIGRAHV